MQKIKGFSLIELMTVVAIIGIITAISIPTFQDWQNKSTYNQNTDVVVGMLNTARNNTQSDKQCKFSGSNELGQWMIEIKPATGDDPASAVLGCFKKASNTFEAKKNTKYELISGIISSQNTLYSGSSLGFKEDSSIRVMWHKDQDALETVSIYAQKSDGNFKIAPVESVAINYVYEPDESYTKPICINRISGYAYLSKEKYDTTSTNNTTALCTE